MITPWSIWCKESRMYIWYKQKFDTSQNALKNRWHPARERSRSYVRLAGPSLWVLPSFLNSTTGRPAPGIPADAVWTFFLTLAVVLALKVDSVSRYDLVGHSQRWHPPGHYIILLPIITYLNFNARFTHQNPQICRAEDDPPQPQPNITWMSAISFLPNATALLLLFEYPSHWKHEPVPRVPDAVDGLYGLQSLGLDDLEPMWYRIQASTQKVSTRLAWFARLHDNSEDTLSHYYVLIPITIYIAIDTLWPMVSTTHNTRDAWTNGLDDLDHLPRLSRWARQWGPKAENFRTRGPSLPFETPDLHCCWFGFQMHDIACLHMLDLE